MLVRRLAAADAGAAARNFIAGLHVNQRLLHKITKIPPHVLMAPAKNGRFDSHSLLLDSDADWRIT